MLNLKAVGCPAAFSGVSGSGARALSVELYDCVLQAQLFTFEGGGFQRIRLWAGGYGMELSFDCGVATFQRFSACLD